MENLPQKQQKQELALTKNFLTESLQKVIEQNLSPAVVQRNNLLPSLKKIKAALGEPYLLQSLIVKIESLLESFNVSVRMSERQVFECAEAIIEEFSAYNEYDFVKCFKNVKTGKYNHIPECKVFNRIDQHVIFSWLNQYDIDRSEEYFNIKEKERKEIDYTEQKPVKPEIAKKLGELADELANKHKLPEVNNEPTEQDILTNKYMESFDRLYHKQDEEVNKKQAIRMVFIKGIPYTQEEYVLMRVEQFKSLGNGENV